NMSRDSLRNSSRTFIDGILRGVSAMTTAIALTTAAFSSGCGLSDHLSTEVAAPEPPATVASEAATAAPAVEEPGLPGGGAAPVTVEPQDLPGSTEGCGPGMVRVEGEYCPAVLQQCLEHHPEWEKRQGEPGVAERCLKYAEPSRC